MYIILSCIVAVCVFLNPLCTFTSYNGAGDCRFTSPAVDLCFKWHAQNRDTRLEVVNVHRALHSVPCHSNNSFRRYLSSFPKQAIIVSDPFIQGSGAIRLRVTTGGPSNLCVKGNITANGRSTSSQRILLRGYFRRVGVDCVEGKITGPMVELIK